MFSEHSKRRESLEHGLEKIDALEKELAAQQELAKKAKNKNDQSKEELSRAVSTGLSMAQVIDDLGITFHEVLNSTLKKLKR